MVVPAPPGNDKYSVKSLLGKRLVDKLGVSCSNIELKNASPIVDASNVGAKGTGDMNEIEVGLTVH